MPDPASYFLRGKDEDNSNSPANKLKHFLEARLQENNEPALVEIIGIKEDKVVTQTTLVTVIDVRFTASDNQRFLSSVKLHGLISQYQTDIEQQTEMEIVAVGIDMCKLTRCDNGCQTLHRADYVKFSNLS